MIAVTRPYTAEAAWSHLQSNILATSEHCTWHRLFEGPSEIADSVDAIRISVRILRSLMACRVQLQQVLPNLHMLR